MTDQTKLETLDVDGAVREAAHNVTETLEAEGDTRLDFFKKAGLAGGAVMGSGTLLSALVPSAAMAKAGGAPPVKIFGKGDIGILNYALALEYLESSFYIEATKKLKTNNPQLKAFLKTVTKDEKAHVAALKSVLKGKAAARPKFNFRQDTSNQGKFIKASATLENTGVSAYSGQAFNIDSPKVLAAALSIVTVEARHASVIGLIQKGSPQGIAPSGPFDKPLKAAQVLKGVSGLHYIKSGPLAS